MMRRIVTETVLGYIFWSLFQGLGPMIWFYPLNELEISGYEAFCLLWLSPIIAFFGTIFNLIQSKLGLACLRVGMLLCIGSFQAPSTLSRLEVLAVGNGLAMLVLVSTLWSKSQQQRCITVWGLVLGFFAVLAGRIWLTSFNPTWWDKTTNSVVLAIGAIATIDKIVTESSKASEDKTKSSHLQCYWFPTSVGFGSLLFLTHWLFGEVSIVTRWTVSGYPDHGPMPYPWGCVILLSLATGVVLSVSQSLANNILWWVVGCLSLIGLYWLPTWKAFACGSILATYTMSIWPEMLDRLTTCPPVKSLLTVMLTYLVEIFFSVWTVAYNFVPGGVYTREHTDYLILCVMVCIGLALFSKRRTKEPSYTSYVKISEGDMPGKPVYIVLLITVMVGLAGFASRLHQQKNGQGPERPNKQFTAAIWTYHFGYDNKGWPSLERSAKMLNETGADIITLLESDASKPFLGNNDLGMWLGEKLNMYVDFGASTRDHTWGNLLLSKFPIVKSKHHLLPSPHGELAPGITATVNISGNLVDFVVTHMGNDRDVLDRKLQAEVLANELRNSPNPAVFLGYVTSAPGSRDYKKLINHGRMKDIDSTDQERWCEYIMYKKLIRLGYARISHAGLSDTEVQVGRFRIPDNPISYQDNDRYVTDAQLVDVNTRFNPRFGPYRHGHNSIPDHLFHMSTPKYFLPRT